MPLLQGQEPSRRDFLRTFGLSAGAILAGGCARIPFLRRKPAEVWHWAFLSDTHVSLDPNEEYRGFRVYDNFKTVVGQVVEASPAGAMISGDLARLEGKEGDYRMLRRLIEPMRSRMPVALGLGNHDDRANFLKVFRTHPGMPAQVEGKHIHEISSGDLRFVMLDSQMFTNITPGLLGKAQREWLVNYLDWSDRRPTFLFLHHKLSDEDNDLLDWDRLSRIIVPRKQVKAVIYGHSHAYRYDRVKGVHLINLPATGYSFADEEPVGWVEARLSAEGGDFTLHAFASNTSDDGKATSLAWRG